MKIACRSVIIHPENKNKILLVQHHGSDFWSLPGGKKEEGESLQQCVIREIEEELGFTPLVKKCIAINEFRYTVDSDPSVEFFFTCILPPSHNPEIIGAGEHFEAELKKCDWVELHDTINIKPDFLKTVSLETDSTFMNLIS